MRALLLLGALGCGTSSQAPAPPPSPVETPDATAPVDAEALRTDVRAQLGDDTLLLDLSCETVRCTVTLVGEAARSRRHQVETELEGRGWQVLKGKASVYSEPMEEWYWAFIVSRQPLSAAQAAEARGGLVAAIDGARRAHRPVEQ